ncbi:MAG TPA: lanthionine synthetase LanC family protein, partial [Ktedonobacteraceae bacterium]|nr:lanthionine synthetase LanC family protein [Ktedonobacteraceae bacterium]
YEHSVFLPEQQNWPDLRDIARAHSQKSEHATMVAWCHGAPGIGLSRLGSLRYLDDATIREEITIAVKTTLEQGFGTNHSLCHGDMGNLDVVLKASIVLNDQRYQEEATRLTAMLLESIECQGWCTGVPMGIETPGLMTGIAGIGYELLRLVDHTRVPSVLLLEPPHFHPYSSANEQ